MSQRRSKDGSSRMLLDVLALRNSSISSPYAPFDYLNPCRPKTGFNLKISDQSPQTR
ncbi:uncharacterized protein G2W53_026336 [Senna tora]|uniref:Uncharacterized protein n=1 Tax=Senna tora TaxID=362788 RepID=A0A834WIQ8_9FABA|nr:uncharacterized protein G2W53_026336 [Senna tora]